MSILCEKAEDLLKQKNKGETPLFWQLMMMMTLKFDGLSIL
jgi:hypothetical protein